MTSQQLFELAMQHHRAGRLAEAEVNYRQLLAIHPQEPDVLHLLGVLAGDAGHPHAAVELIRQAIAIKPTAASYHSNIANSLLALHRLEEAVTAAKTAIQLQPDLAGAHYNLGLAHLVQRQWDAAVPAFEAALRLQPDYAYAHLNLGNAHQGRGRLDEAITAFRNGLAHAPRHAALWNNLGSALRVSGDLIGAAQACRTAIECDPYNPRLLNNLALVLMDEGDPRASIDTLQRSLTLEPQQSEIRSNLIFFAHSLPDGSSLLRDQLAAWQRLHAEPLRQFWAAHQNDRSRDRPLRIGYVSPDFRDHVVGRTVLPVFLAHDRQQFEITCYSEFADIDPLATQFREGAARWRITAGQSDEQVAAQIRADGIDVLVDLALHTSDNRLLVFARKPAPVQVSWLGYPGTTGLDTIDYVITDDHLDPPGLNADYYSEELIRLPGAWCCYHPPGATRDPVAPPAATSGRITFGSLNKFSKINDRVLALWGRILTAVDGSQLCLLAKDEVQKQHIYRSLAAHGIASERIGFFDYLPAPEAARRADSTTDFLHRYERIDIALDPFPYNGMTTTAEALWMGTPVVTFAGKLPVSRASLSLLSTVGLSDLAAHDEDEYVRIAVSLAADRARLIALRATLRGRMQQSPLLDVPRFARHLEAAYRTMWRRWCST